MSIILSLIQNDYDIFQIEQAQKIQHISTRPKLNNAKILLAEDNPINQQVAKEMLVKAGANITLVENGALAVTACQQNKYDLVLMDMQMPIMDGYQAAEIIRKSYNSNQLPIIAMTANVMKGDREKCLSYGMNNYIGKPIVREQLLTMLELYINKDDEKQTKKLPIAAKHTSKFNLNQLADKFDNLELALELVSLFFDTHKDDSKLISNLLSNDLLDDARKVFHKLKGSSGELDLLELHQLTAEIEAQLKQNKSPQPNLLEEFNLQLTNILKHFAELISKH